jgi:hypothetical protein
MADQRSYPPARGDEAELFRAFNDELGEHRARLEDAAKEAGWTIEREGSIIVVRDVWTENEDHAAWLVATKVRLPLERVTVWAGRGA